MTHLRTGGMELFFKSRKLERACTTERESVRMWGAQRAQVVRRRIAQLQAAENLAVISTLPPSRLHPLAGDRAGQFAVDAVHPFRLVFEPWHDPLPTLPDGGIDKSKITEIRILDIEDYHGR
jgi:proteic killer suppression protein